jgi:hypothetical protein
MEIQWVWKGEPTYSRVVTSAAYVFRNADSARRAFEARDELALYTASLLVKRRESVDLGDEAEQLQGRGLNSPASGIAWRDGRIIGLVVVEPGKDDTARQLALKQRARFEQAPSSSSKQSENDPELQLDDPHLSLPVYWLGRSYDPPGAMPPLKLFSARVGGAGPGQSIQLWYNGVTLDTWTLGAWAQFKRTRLGRLIWDSPCARKTVIEIEGGHAEIFWGYAASHVIRRPCPGQPPNRLIAHVYYDEIVVVVDMPYCYTCVAASSGPYATLSAMKLLVRALHARGRRS